MVQNVESLLEETLSQLQKAKELKLLNGQEVRGIIKKRRNYEHLIRREAATREHFLRYAVFEKELARFIRSRARRRKLERSKCNPLLGQLKLQVNRVYNRALQRFPGDDKLWIHVAKSAIEDGETKRASRIFSQAISRCGGCPRIWLAAINFHFEKCNNPRAARVLAQRALRAMPTSFDLWLEYFRMELFYLTKLTARRFVIGLDVDESSRNDAPGSQEDAEVVPPDLVGGASSNLECLEFWDGGVPLAVLKGALSKSHVNEFQCVQCYQVATECPLVPAKLLSGIVTIFEGAFPSSVIVKSMKLRAIWDVAKAENDREFTKLENNVTLAVAEESDTRHEERRSNLIPCGQHCVKDITDLVRADTSWHDPPHVTRALQLLLETFGCAVDKVQRGYGDELLQPLLQEVNTVKANGSLPDKGEKDKSSSEKIWDLNRLREYLMQGGDELGVSYEDVCSAVMKECLVPFRSGGQDEVLSMYFSKEVDVSRVVAMCKAMLSLPPITMKSMLAATKAILLLEANGDHYQGIETENSLLVRKIFRKACQLPEAKTNINFWISYINFEQQIARDAPEASAVHAKALRTINSTNHNDFLESLMLHMLS